MSNYKIMIVEDERIVAADIQASIEKMGYAVCAMASSGMEAIKKADSNRPDLILMDIVLKGSMDGIEAATRIKELYKIPVVYLTAFGDDSILQRAKVAEPYGYITKPFSQRELQIAIEISIYKKQAEDRIHKMELWLATVLKSIGDAVIASDKDRRITFMNAVAEKLTGWNQADALGKNLTEVLNIKDQDLRDLEKHLVEKVITEGLIINLIEDRLLIAKDGSELPISDSAAPIKNDNNESPGSVIVFRDITEHKRANEALRESEEQYRSIFDNAIEGIFQTTPEGRFLTVNPAMAHMHGFASPEEMVAGITDIGKQLYVNPEDRERYRGYLNENGEVSSFEAQVYRRDGSIIWTSASTRAINDAAGNIFRFEGTAVDITDRKRVEEENRNLQERLQRSEKMEALGQLAGGVAHDLNNVLGILSGYSELLLGEIPEGSRSHGYVEKILESTRKGAAIIEDLLTLARRSVTASEVINLNSVVADFLETPVFEKITAYHPRVTFRTEYDEDLLNIKGSPVHLEKALMNLVSNAAEAMSGEGEVTIRTESLYKVMTRSRRGIILS